MNNNEKKVILLVGGLVLPSSLMIGLINEQYATEWVSTGEEALERLGKFRSNYGAVVVTEEIRGALRHEFARTVRNALSHQKGRSPIICLVNSGIERITGTYTLIPNTFDELRKTLTEEFAAQGC